MLLVGDEVAVWGALADEEGVADYEAGLEVRGLVRLGNVGVPTGKVLSVEQGTGLGCRLARLVGSGEEGQGNEQGEDLGLHGVSLS